MVIAVSVLCALMGLALGSLLAKVNLSKQVETAKAEAQAVSDSLKGQVASLQANLLVAENNAALIKQHAAESKKEREEDFARQLNAMKAQFVAVSEELLQKRANEFKGANKEQMDSIAKPLLQELENMRKQLGETKEGSDKSIAELSGALKTMMEQSVKLGQDAENLADALKNRDKAKGQLNEGRGNIISRFQGMQSLGITSTKTVNEKLLS